MGEDDGYNEKILYIIHGRASTTTTTALSSALSGFMLSDVAFIIPCVVGPLASCGTGSAEWDCILREVVCLDLRRMFLGFVA